ncbi:conserved hypothetical protein [Verticillium alfalfae VaMs.102]|uniref:Uncharacterized protein n=1 Tax=Verticillium alfalfae (strain VaMs.102 / ATCC MYA-4576 / FGSC 10136) TaxID=526221 RepID=C9SVT7_VERA1|nr:conserved hypothetical protein [Verticillium alfalfae VaMs.102]EEY22902.1 conserved hypothetical protein [Verticillium alfalfae VaMs.102]
MGKLGYNEQKQQEIPEGRGKSFQWASSRPQTTLPMLNSILFEPTMQLGLSFSLMVET